MRIFVGTVADGVGLATPNLDRVKELIEARAGFAHLESGTLNLKLREDYIVEPEQLITAEEYGGEALKLKRCADWWPQGANRQAGETRDGAGLRAWQSLSRNHERRASA